MTHSIPAALGGVGLLAGAILAAVAWLVLPRLPARAHPVRTQVHAWPLLAGLGLVLLGIVGDIFLHQSSTLGFDGLTSAGTAWRSVLLSGTPVLAGLSLAILALAVGRLSRNRLVGLTGIVGLVLGLVGCAAARPAATEDAHSGATSGSADPRPS